MRGLTALSLVIKVSVERLFIYRRMSNLPESVLSDLTRLNVNNNLSFSHSLNDCIRYPIMEGTIEHKEAAMSLEHVLIQTGYSGVGDHSHSVCVFR